jgi:RNA polymerase sigma-B factor
MTAASSKKGSHARERLLESHLPLVHSIARRYAGRGEPVEDLVQVGAMGLVKAGQRFDESRGVAFAAFAAQVIDGEIRRHLRDKSSLMRIPRDLQQASGRLRRTRGQLAAAGGHLPSAGELARALDTDEEQVERVLRAELASELVPLPPDADGLGGLCEGDGQGSDERLSIATCLRALDERERKIVFLRFHADMTERQIASELHLSQAQVSRLLGRALTSLRAELTNPTDGTSNGDSAADGVISPGFTGETGPGESRKSERSHASGERAAARIAPMPRSRQSLDVAHYLELPYTVGVQSERDGEVARWTATVEELPGCAGHGETPDDAVELLRSAMRSWIEAALAQGREIPLPSDQAAKRRPSASHSGRFLVRMPGALHTQLAHAAERDHLSLNRFITNVLTTAVSPRSAVVAEPGAAAQRATQPAAQTHEGPTAQALEMSRIARERRGATTRSRGFRLALATNVALIVITAVAAIVLLVLALHNGA